MSVNQNKNTRVVSYLLRAGVAAAAITVIAFPAAAGSVNVSVGGRGIVSIGGGGGGLGGLGGGLGGTVGGLGGNVTSGIGGAVGGVSSGFGGGGSGFFSGGANFGERAIERTTSSDKKGHRAMCCNS